jgi:hypothetical protein
MYINIFNVKLMTLGFTIYYVLQIVNKVILKVCIILKMQKNKSIIIILSCKFVRINKYMNQFKLSLTHIV